MYELKQGTKEELLGGLRIFNAKAFSKRKTARAILRDEKKIEMTVQHDKVNEMLSLSSQVEISLNNLIEIEWEK